MVFGDLYQIAERVKEFDPTYRLRHIEGKKYKVIAKKRREFKEGVLNGHPLYSLRDYEETVFEWEGTPDERIITKLHETDIWRYPGGPMAWYDDMERRNEREKQKREESLNNEVAYVASEHHSQVFDTKKSFVMGKVG